MLNNIEDKIYLFCAGGFIEAPQDWYNELRDDQFTTDYDEVKNNGLYMIPSQEQIDFNIAHPNLELYNAFYMIPKDTEDVNEEIRKQREALYLSTTDRLYMSYVKYKEFGETEKAEQAYREWKNAVLNVEETNPYLL